MLYKHSPNGFNLAQKFGLASALKAQAEEYRSSGPCSSSDVAYSPDLRIRRLPVWLHRSKTRVCAAARVDINH